MLPPQRRGGGDRRDGDSHKETCTKQKLCSSGNVVKEKKKEAQMQRSVGHLFESASKEQMARDPFCKTTTKTSHHSGTDSARQFCSLDEVLCQSKQNTIGLPISLANMKPNVWSVLWSSSSTENCSPGLYTSRTKWCSHLVGSSFYSRCERTAVETTTRLA